MTFQKIALAGALVAAGFVAGLAGSQPTQAQSGGRWEPAGSFDNGQGGEVWMINPITGEARNCYWTGTSPYRYITCQNSQ